MIEAIAYFNISGEKFSPRAAEKLSGINFTEKNEPGDIANFGRYKGEMRPFGSASIVIRGGNVDVLMKLLEIIEGKIQEFKSQGADYLVIHLAINYKTQCNLEFSPAEIKKISDLGIPFTISCVNF